MNFCSDCVWAKIVDETDKTVIYCTKTIVTDRYDNPSIRIKKLNIRKRLTSIACGNFEYKKDSTADR